MKLGVEKQIMKLYSCARCSPNNAGGRVPFPSRVKRWHRGPKGPIMVRVRAGIESMVQAFAGGYGKR